MVVGHYQPLADDGSRKIVLAHRPTKPVFCSRVRRRRKASLYAADCRNFKSPPACFSSASGGKRPRAEGTAPYLISALPPASSNFFLAASASALLMPSLTALG